MSNSETRHDPEGKRAEFRAVCISADSARRMADRTDFGRDVERNAERDSALAEVSALFSSELRRLAQNSYSGAELAAEAIALLFPDIEGNGPEAFIVQANNPLVPELDDILTGYATQHVGVVLDNIDESIDLVTAKWGKITEHEAELVADLKRVTKDPDSWRAVHCLALVFSGKSPVRQS